MIKVVEVKALDNYHIWVLFSDKFESDINLSTFITTGISEQLADAKYFQNVKIDEFGGIYWENGFDFCPNYLREIAEKSKSYT